MRNSQDKYVPAHIEDIEKWPDPKWLIDGVLPEKGAIVLYGAPKNGKGFVALDWGLSIASGREWFGHRVEQGAVAYIYSEGTTGLAAR